MQLRARCNIVQQRAPRLTRARASAGSHPSVVAVHQDDAQTWSKFSASVSGEWEGVTVSFNPDGTPQPLPERFVPGAYREWGVELYDWQSQCSSCVDDGRALRSTVRRLMPTVGCEADAVAFVEEVMTTAASTSDAPANASEAIAVLPDGSYSTGPASFDPESASKLRFEACFAMPGLSTEGTLASAAGSRWRIKVAQVLARNWMDGSWRVASVELHRERYDGPHTGRQELAGCGGGQPAIAKLTAVDAAAVSGSWVVESSTVLDISSGSGKDSSGAAASSEVVTYLPLGAWSVVRTSGAGCVVAEAGALSGDGVRRQVAARGYDNGAVQRVSLAVESRSA